MLVKMSNNSFSLVEIKGDSLAHYVSKDLYMGKGIAPLFVNKFGSVDELKAQKGDVAYLRRNGKFIFYLITKERYYYKPTYANCMNYAKNRMWTG
ncbi:hypothetical protein BH23THE1_BH23THE1_35070 [soil metagenome]